MDKGKRGEKPVKFPQPLFTSWKTVLNTFTEKHANVKLTPVVLALEKLVASETKPYDKQASCIREAIKLMQKNDQDINQVKEIVAPIASLGYFAACENLSRRTFVPLIETSLKYTQSLSHFTHHYQQYITNVSSEPSFEDKPLSQKALTIYATLKFTLGQQVVEQYYQPTLQFLLNGLEHAQQQLKNSSNLTSATHKDQYMNDIQFTLKTMLVLFSHHLEIAPQVFAKLLSADQKDNNSDVILLKRVALVLLDICMDTTTFIKECNQVAGMALGAFMNLSNSAVFARDWVLGWFFSRESNQAVEYMTSIGIAPPDVGNWDRRDAPMIFILRGLVSSLRKEIVTMDCPTTTQSGKNLHEMMFYGINFFCSRANLDASCKLIAFESMATWLQQTKDMMKNKESIEAVSGPIQPKNINLLIQYVLDHWDDPIDSMQHKVRSIFELSLSTLEIKTQHNQEEYHPFMFGLLKNLISMDWHRKVKYALLNMLVEKVHTDTFLTAEPQLMDKCFRAMDSFVLCPQITYFVLTFLYRRIQDTIPGHKDFKGHNGKIKDDGNNKVALQAWMDLWVMPLLRCLTAPSELLRKNASGFMLQPLYKISPQSFWYMVQIVQEVDKDVWAQEELDPALRLNAFIAVLKAGRGLDIVNGDSYNTSKISVETLKLAIYHSDSQVRMDVLGLLCESRKATAEVTAIELDLLRLFLPLNMNSTAPEFRQQMCAHLTKLLTRLRGNVYSRYRNYKSLMAYANKNTGEKRANALLDAQDMLDSIDVAKSFLYWLCDHLAESLYPGASYQRVATALRLLSFVVKIFGVTELPAIEGFTDQQPDFPFKMPIANARFSKLLVDIFMNPYEFNRAQAFDILCQFPSPLPGIESKNDVQNLLWWGLNNVVSTRAGESDSGAMVFRLIFNKYVVGLDFDLSPEQNHAATGGDKKEANTSSAIVFTERLLDLLEKQVTIAKTNLLLAAQQHPMHGTLLALQYVFQELDYNSTVKEHGSIWKNIHKRAIALIHMTCDTAMPVLSDASPEGNIPTDYREDDEEEDEEDELEQTTEGPKHQVILSCCWRAVKEASTLLQVMISKAPASSSGDDAILSHDELVKSGLLFQHLLTNIRHRGAFSAVYPAYVSLNTRLIMSRDTTIAQLPATWLQENLDSLTSSNISITRRSAGLPLCILAIVSSEPSVKKELLNKAMTYLMELARSEPPVDADQRIDLPQVHAYNIMRTIFMDSKLGNHVLEYASQGFSLAINGFSSHSWAIRNCSVMLFSTLLQRTFGTKKTRDEHSTVNTLTGREFFVRFPDLHPYLLKELGVAVDQLLKNSLAASVHPGLYPILTLLSRMQPSTEDVNENETVLTPFIPLVMPCAASAIYKTREMAARALVPLVQDVVPTIKQSVHLNNTMTQNEIHGRFLQVQFLLRGHFYRSNNASSFIQFVNDMPTIMVALLELLEAQRFCNVNSALLLSIISEFFFDNTWITSSGKDKEIVSELLEASSKNFAELKAKSVEYCIHAIKSDQINGIGTYLVRENMANIIVMGTLNTARVDISPLLFLLSDHDYEVRLLVLQKFLDYFKSHAAEGIKELQSVLVQRTFAGEDSLNCFVLTAKLLMALYSENPYPVETKMPFTLEQYWDKLVIQFTEKRALSVTESVLPLLGALLAQILREKNDNQEWVKQCLVTWSGYVEKHSKPDVTLPLRESVVKSLTYTSKQIFESTFEDEQVIDVNNAKVTAILTITQLLQDDDIDVREETASLVSYALSLQVPVHHERALELVHRYLTAHFKQSELLDAKLSSSLEGNHTLQQVWENELSQSKALFAKENPNIFKEDLIDVQWANVDLDILRTTFTPKSFVPERVNRTIKQLTLFTQVLRSMARTLMQNGPYGITSKPTIFIATYGNIVSLHLELELLEKMPSIPEELVQSLRDLSHAVADLTEESVHPLIWGLLRGDEGIYGKTKTILKRKCGLLEFNDMFLLSFDSRRP